MNKSLITDISLLSSIAGDRENWIKLFSEGIFSKPENRKITIEDNSIPGLKENIKSPLKKRMSQLSLGIFQALQNGGAANITANDEIYLFTGFGEIDTTDKIINSIIIDNDQLVSPTWFHNSVHNTPLGYFTIINKLHNYCTTISDGLDTGNSFIDFINKRTMIDSPFIIAAGEEASGFYKLDATCDLEIIPGFCSYKIIPGESRGFIYKGAVNRDEELIKICEKVQADNIFSDLDSFYKLKDHGISNIQTDYPVSGNNPCSIISRLALPFLLELEGISLVIENDNNQYHIFEVEV